MALTSFARYLAVAAACLGACATPPSAPPVAGVDVVAEYAAAVARGESILEVEAGASLVEVEVRAAGPLAPFGHAHLVALRSLRGWGRPQAGLAEVRARAMDFSVDEPALRAAAGMDKQPDADAIAATRQNMLDKVLEVQRFAEVGARLRRKGSGWRLSVEIRGVTRDYALEPQFETVGAGMRAHGSVEIRQSDFGIEPFAVLGGLLRVDDVLKIRFDIRAAQKKAGPG